jgi:hypothetical protein
VNRRRLLLFAAIWVATVVTASTATWAVISATGAKVGQSIPMSAPTTEGPSMEPTSSTTPHSSTEPSATSTASKSSEPTHSRPSITTVGTPTITRSWSGEAGTVTASCTGSTVSLVSAVPAVGYRAHADGSGTRQLEVEFESAEGEDHETHLKVWCDSGAPVFRRD